MAGPALRCTPRLPACSKARPGEDPLSDDDPEPTRPRLTGLLRNPAIPARLLRRLVDEQNDQVRQYIPWRPEWTPEQFEELATHPDPEVRAQVARAQHITSQQRARFVEDPAGRVVAAMVQGPEWITYSHWDDPEPVLPEWAYRRARQRVPYVEVFFDTPWLPAEWLARLLPPGKTTAPVEPAALTRDEAEAMVADENSYRRRLAAQDPRLPADLVRRLAGDADHGVRLAVSMRPELTEEQRAAIDHRIEPETRVSPPAWVVQTTDRDVQHAIARSAHPGLRRGLAGNQHLDPALIPVLAADDDHAVRLLLCESQRDVPFELLLATYLEATVMTRFRLLTHPAFDRDGLALRLAGHPDPAARALARLDPHPPAGLIERLSHDEHPQVRQSVAAHRLLSPARVLALFAAPETTGQAAASPHLPVAVMEQILTDAAP